MELKRVVVTGLGAVTPVGNSPEETWKNLVDGVSGAAPITTFDTTLFKTKFACEVKGLNVNDYLDRKEARKMDRYTQLALIAATWNDTQIVDFNFGNQVLPKVVESGYVPPYSIWNGHAVALVDSIDEHTEKLLLFSLKEWTDVSASVKNSMNANMADSIANSYVEGDLDGWTIPTKEQAKRINEIYYENCATPLTDLLSMLDGGGVGVWSTEDNARYLCEDATQTFDFKQLNRVSSAGAGRLYRLRLVKVYTHNY